MMWTGVGRPRTACDRCSSLKIRCTGERPTCRRCERLRNPCFYGGTAGPKSHVFVPVNVNRHVPKPLSRQQNGTQLPRHTATRIENGLSSTASTHPDYPGMQLDLGIPKPLVLSLAKVFFENAYNATLLLHERVFLASLEDGTANPYIVLSVCAWAAKYYNKALLIHSQADQGFVSFYRDHNGQATLKEQGFMTEWAKKAGRLVFQQPETLSEDNVVTLTILGLFWYSQGSWRLSQFYKGVACQMLHVIGLGSAKLQIDNSFGAEIRRRRLWACYLMQCQSADNLSFFESIASLSSLTLPWPEEDFNTGIARSPPESLKDSRSADAPGSLYAELIKGLTLWSSVQSLIKCRETDISRLITDLHALDNQISTWWRGVSPSFKLTSATITASNDSESFPRVLLLNAVYHQSLGALHASIVPLFSWGSGDATWSAARQCSAQIAYEQACSFSELIKAVLCTYIRTSAIPTFVAYAAYSGCAVQIPFMWCSNTAVRERINANVRANIKMIQNVAAYWKFAALLQIHVGCLYELHRAQSNELEDEPRHLDIRRLTEFKVNASYARISILGFIDILRPKGDGFVNSGDESNDLGIQHAATDDPWQMEQSAPNHHAHDQESGPTHSEHRESNNSAPPSTSANGQGRRQDFAHTMNPLVNPDLSQYHATEEPGYQHVQTELLRPQGSQEPRQDVTERLTLDPYYPFFDQAMLDLFPNGEMAELSQLEADLGDLDYFELQDWMGGTTDAGEGV